MAYRVFQQVCHSLRGIYVRDVIVHEGLLVPLLPNCMHTLYLLREGIEAFEDMRQMGIVHSNHGYLDMCEGDIIYFPLLDLRLLVIHRYVLFTTEDGTPIHKPILIEFTGAS